MSNAELKKEITELKAQVAALTKKQHEFEAILQKYVLSKDEVRSPDSKQTTKHIMLSYNWGIQDHVKAVCAELKSRGLPVWMDIDGGMHGSIHMSMASAVEGAYVVIPFMTPAYEGSANCKKELSYADDNKVKIVPVMAENDYKQQSWLGLITAGMLWVDFRDKKNVKNVVDQLLSEIYVLVPELAKVGGKVMESTVPYSGNWRGFWIQEGYKGEMECDFFFDDKGHITGKGADEAGPFTWKGTFDGKHRTASIIKTYPTHVIQYEGKVIGRKQIKGRWVQVGEPDNAGEFELQLK